MDDCSASYDPKKVKKEVLEYEEGDEEEVEEEESDSEGSSAQALRYYEDVMKDLNVDMDDLEETIKNYGTDAETWINGQAVRNVSQVHANNPWTRNKAAKETTKYKQMLLAQKRKAIQQFHERAFTNDFRLNPGRSAKTKVAHCGYKEEEDSDRSHQGGAR
ncbi:hypothetical protein GCK72_019422 [Caenorhabditis remanei]|uniref:Uncharacterized protein n=1 Tax=Caenorhabditis remanei TaxID=31234 RepID=A0A6A5GC89_CAERE|nr:hypothetical protein GCK72_019422 [Caenorhabditis remanei]KAF1752867.1 hypothetical protein GCK72_019422 [Caenorhabditis remanei]